MSLIKMFNLSSFLKVNSPLNTLYRMKHGKHNKKYLYKDAKLINGTINYYPKQPDEPETVIEAAKLFRVQRIKPIRGNPYWERRLLREFGIYNECTVNVVKNIPENNARLWKIKHLIKVTPINFPFGEPSAEDLNHTYLKENGDCIVIKNIESLNERIEAAEKFQKDKKILDGDTLRNNTRLQWINPW